MEIESSNVKSEVNIEEKSNEFQIIKNNIIYNIKLILVKDEICERIEITISFVFEQNYFIYETYFPPLSEVKESLNLSEIYQQLTKEFENKNFEIIHPIDDSDECITLKIDINNELKSIKFEKISLNDTIKLNELIKNYKSLEEKYIKLEKEKVKDSDSLKNNYEFEYNHADSYNNSDDNNDNINENNNTNTYTLMQYENSDANHIILNTLNTYFKIWCMLVLNKINFIENNEEINLNLVALGLSNNRIILINLNTLKIHQEISAPNTVYSLAKFNDDSNYFIGAFENGQMIIYKLNQDKFEQHQLLEKPEELKKGEINKVITLSDGNIATAERGALSIWKPNAELGEKKYELFKEIITHSDTCQLLEVNPEVFACAIYRTKLINVYKNDGNEYPLLGSITNAESHGSNSNGMAKINNNIFCSGGEKSSFYIVSVEPLQVIQKIILDDKSNFNFTRFIYKSYDGFIFTSVGEGIIQYKIVTDQDGNFIKLEEFSFIEDGINNTAIITTEDGKIFYKQHLDNMDGKTNLFLTNYKKLDN